LLEANNQLSEDSQREGRQNWHQN